MKCAHNTTPFRYLGSAHVLSTLISTSQLQHHIPPVSIWPWRGTGEGQGGNILALLDMLLWTRLFGLQGLAGVHQISSFGNLLQMHQSLRVLGLLLWSFTVCLTSIILGHVCLGTLPRNWKAEKSTSCVCVEKTQNSFNKGFVCCFLSVSFSKCN